MQELSFWDDGGGESLLIFSLLRCYGNASFYYLFLLKVFLIRRNNPPPPLPFPIVIFLFASLIHIFFEFIRQLKIVPNKCNGKREISPFFGVFLIELKEKTARPIVIRVMKGKFQQGAEVVCKGTTQSDAFLLPFFIRSALGRVQVHASLTALHPDRPSDRCRCRRVFTALQDSNCACGFPFPSREKF